jgi:hypothetical protein
VRHVCRPPAPADNVNQITIAMETPYDSLRSGNALGELGNAFSQVSERSGLRLRSELDDFIVRVPIGGGGMDVPKNGKQVFLFLGSFGAHSRIKMGNNFISEIIAGFIDVNKSNNMYMIGVNTKEEFHAYHVKYFSYEILDEFFEATRSYSIYLVDFKKRYAVSFYEDIAFSTIIIDNINYVDADILRRFDLNQEFLNKYKEFSITTLKKEKDFLKEQVDSYFAPACGNPRNGG